MLGELGGSLLWDDPTGHFGGSLRVLKGVWMSLGGTWGRLGPPGWFWGLCERFGWSLVGFGSLCLSLRGIIFQGDPWEILGRF